MTHQAFGDLETSFGQLFKACKMDDNTCVSRCELLSLFRKQVLPIAMAVCQSQTLGFQGSSTFVKNRGPQRGRDVCERARVHEVNGYTAPMMYGGPPNPYAALGPPEPEKPKSEARAGCHAAPVRRRPSPFVVGSRRLSSVVVGHRGSSTVVRWSVGRWLGRPAKLWMGCNGGWSRSSRVGTATRARRRTRFSADGQGSLPSSVVPSGSGASGLPSLPSRGMSM